MMHKNSATYHKSKTHRQTEGMTSSYIRRRENQIFYVPDGKLGYFSKCLYSSSIPKLVSWTSDAARLKDLFH